MAITLIRTIILYILIIVSLRIMGKRQIGELQPTELVITILISNIASLPIEDPSVPLLIGIIPILTLVCFDVLISVLTLYSSKLRNLISGNPKLIIKNGIIDQKVVKELRFSTDDLLEQIRTKDVFNLEEIDYAIVETTGNISIYKKFEYQNVNTRMLNIKNSGETIPFVVISDGHIVTKNLSYCNMTVSKIKEEVAKQKLDTDNIYLMTANSNGDFIIIPKENK